MSQVEGGVPNFTLIRGVSSYPAGCAATRQCLWFLVTFNLLCLSLSIPGLLLQ